MSARNSSQISPFQAQASELSKRFTAPSPPKKSPPTRESRIPRDAATSASIRPTCLPATLLAKGRTASFVATRRRMITPMGMTRSFPLTSISAWPSPPPCPKMQGQPFRPFKKGSGRRRVPGRMSTRSRCSPPYSPRKALFSLVFRNSDTQVKAGGLKAACSGHSGIAAMAGSGTKKSNVHFRRETDIVRIVPELRRQP